MTKAPPLHLTPHVPRKHANYQIPTFHPDLQSPQVSLQQLQVLGKGPRLINHGQVTSIAGGPPIFVLGVDVQLLLQAFPEPFKAGRHPWTSLCFFPISCVFQDLCTNRRQPTEWEADGRGSEFYI